MACRWWGVAFGCVAFGGFVGGCGPQVEPRAEFVEVCGVADPVLLLEFDPDRAPVPVSSPVEIDDRLYFVVGARTADGVASDPTELWSTGPCGEGPLRIAEGVWSVFTSPLQPGLLLGHTSKARGDVVVLDPRGEAAPVPLVQGVERSDAWTDYGVVTTDAIEGFDPRRVWLRPWPARIGDAPAASVALFDGALAHRYSVHTRGDEVFARRDDDAIVVVDLADPSAVAVVLEGVDAYTVSADARWIYWSSSADGRGSLLDRQTGARLDLGDDVRIPLTIPALFDDYLLVKRDSDPAVGQRLVRLSTLEMTDIPVGIDLFGRYDERRWYGSVGDAIAVLDLETGVQRVVLDEGPWWIANVETGGGITALTGSLDARDGLRDEGELWWASVDGDSELLAERATPHWRRLGDGRVITPVDVDDDVRGTLTVSDPDTLQVATVEDDVHARGLATFPEHHGPHAVVYAVADGERAGYWVAAIGPTPPE